LSQKFIFYLSEDVKYRKRYLLGNLQYEYLKTRDKQRNGEREIKMIACFDEQYH
jgi:hypothetical protein